MVKLDENRLLLLLFAVSPFLYLIFDPLVQAFPINPPTPTDLEGRNFSFLGESVNSHSVYP
jgi:hypothetical protein